MMDIVRRCIDRLLEYMNGKNLNSDVNKTSENILTSILAADVPHFFDTIHANFILSKYDKFSSRQEEIEYHSNHLNRYLLTLDLMYAFPRDISVLEIGAPPYGLSMLIKNMLFKNMHMSSFNDKQNTKTNPNPSSNTVKFNLANGSVEEYEIPQFNVELDKWPYPDSAFDLIIASEVIEHLAYDPMNVFCEANRVLKSDGSFLVTVPNAASYSNLARILAGDNPNGFPYYRPEGINMRHNREITCRELTVLFQCAGFEVSTMKTVNSNSIYLDDHMIQIIKEVANIAGLTDLNKEVIMSVAKKSGGIIERFPVSERLYYEWDLERLRAL